MFISLTLIYSIVGLSLAWILLGLIVIGLVKNPNSRCKMYNVLFARETDYIVVLMLWPLIAVASIFMIIFGIFSGIAERIPGQGTLYGIGKLIDIVTG